MPECVCPTMGDSLMELRAGSDQLVYQRAEVDIPVDDALLPLAKRACESGHRELAKNGKPSCWVSRISKQQQFEHFWI